MVESVTLMTKVNDPAVVGVPDRVPLVERLSPAGSTPEPKLQL